MLCEECSARELKAMRALESLTPSGSEFVGDVERCVAFVQDNRAAMMRQIVSLTKRLHALEGRDGK